MEQDINMTWTTVTCEEGTKAIGALSVGTDTSDHYHHKSPMFKRVCVSGDTMSGLNKAVSAGTETRMCRWKWFLSSWFLLRGHEQRRLGA